MVECADIDARNERVRPFFGRRQQVRERAVRRVRAHDRMEAEAAGQCHRFEVAVGNAATGIDDLAREQRQMDGEKRVAVGCRCHDLARADREVAADILNDDRLRNDLLLVDDLLHRARENVRRPARAERHDHANRFLGPLRQCGRRSKKHGDQHRSEFSDHFHSSRLFFFDFKHDMPAAFVTCYGGDASRRFWSARISQRYRSPGAVFCAHVPIKSLSARRRRMRRSISSGSQSASRRVVNSARISA